ncbi:MAG: hypothetical protein M1834_007196 [Cirrosporium novae-zelandiae]|nr:MAG: hypothetical protein M1834_007196 [Cirrosporium novae-zelandiae]
MGVGAFMEPLVVVTLLFGGTWVNRNRTYTFPGIHQKQRYSSTTSRDVEAERSSLSDSDSGYASPKDSELLLSGPRSRSASPSLLATQESPYRRRQLRILCWRKNVTSPNTAVFRERMLSRLLLKFPFLVEAWYWALIYWIYQLGRAATALTLQEGTVNVARVHALHLIELEKKLHIFWEVPIQQFFLGHPALMDIINPLYSFIHIPGTILFLVWLFYYTVTRNRLGSEYKGGKHGGAIDGSPAGPALFEARRRTMAVCNLIAFIIFTLWPCMPPRLLSDESVKGPTGELARSYGFVDTVHGGEGKGSVWTENRFCNQYAAMPSLHFGYALLVGLTVMTIPLPPQHRRSRMVKIPIVNGKYSMRLRIPSWHRLLCTTVGFVYPASIIIAIIATANHFIVDAIAGSMVCALAWWGNGILLNLLPLEDYFLWAVRIHKPERRLVDVLEGNQAEDGDAIIGHGILCD